MAANYPERTSDPVYVRRVVSGKVEYIRLNFNVVTLDFKDDRGKQTFVEPAANAIFDDTGAAPEGVVGEIRVYDSAPYPGTSFND